ncbi:hypothetical protein [Maribacter sp. IgM3_T14_3]|uniref:hypothetical protein n=1 Tax=Maribacter sp. IgM3_T14_3 TaxID=3415140 RepID=UPI003C6F71BF
MINLYLKAKHWQLFILMLGIPLAYQLYTISHFFGLQTHSNSISEGGVGVTEVLNDNIFYFDYFPYVMILHIVMFFGWLWSIAIGLQQNIPSEIKMKVKKFKVLFFIPLIYIISILLLMAGLFSGTEINSFSFIGWPLYIILLLHLFSMFCIFYCMYFVAKTIKTAELKRKVEFGDFAGEFFLLWFYFIGVCIIQPKVNKLYKDENTAINNSQMQ